MSLKRRSAQRREGRKISFGKIEAPIGTSTVAPPKERKLSQYRRPEEAPVAVSQ